jgi:acylphosphatase
MIARHLMIHGRVQGVGFRHFAERTALRLALAGWIRNRADGTVETHVEGDEKAVQAFIEWAHKGPAGAIVIKVMVSEVDHIDASNFERHPTL